jgi:TonB family protein
MAMNDKNKKSLILFTPSGCLTGDALMIFVSGMLAGEEQTKAQKHISECPLCSDASEGLRMWLNEKNKVGTFTPEHPDTNYYDLHELPGDPTVSEVNPGSPLKAVNEFHIRTEEINNQIKQRLHIHALIESGKIKRLSYKPFVWLSAAASIILIIGAGYVLWLQNQQAQKLQAQKLLQREAALIAQIPETLPYPPSDSKVILNVKFNGDKGTHIPPVLTIVNEDITQASDISRASRKNAANTDDNAEYTETRQGVESDVFREESGMYKGQNSKHTLTAKNSGGAMEKAETDEETSSVFISVQQMPSFPGGDAARKKYLSKKLKYPVQASENGIQGTVYISFVVKTDGSLANFKILHGIGGGCDEEALRVVKLMPRWKPGRQNGKSVRTLINMPVYFKLQEAY